jgi:hypothetical protein
MKTKTSRIKDGMIVRDNRTWFSFITKDGRRVGTRDDEEAKARERVITILKVELKEAA